MSERNIASVSSEPDQRFDHIFDRYHADVFRFCVRRLERSDAEDAAAEVFAVAWRRIDEVPSDESTKAWLLGVAHRIVRNQYRGRNRRRRLTTRLEGLREDTPETAEGIMVRHEENEAVRLALNRLRRADRELLCLDSWDRLTHQEIAQVLGINENAVAQRLFRARSRLRQQFDRVYRTSSRIESEEASA